MITIYKLFPGHLNLNGDAENANVLATRLEWAAVPHRVIEVIDEAGLVGCIESLERTPNSAIVVIGHGSQAALKSLEQLFPNIHRLFQRMLELGVPGIGVASGLSLIQRFAGSGERSSRSYTLSLDIEGWPNRALGYCNSNATDAMVRVEGNVILTHLHGPFLAKNQDWANKLLELVGAQLSETEQTATAQGHLDKIWALPQD